MSWKTKTENNIEKNYFLDDETSKEVLVFEIYKGKKLIKFYPKDGKFFLKEITLNGFEEIPADIFKSGSLKGGLLYFLDDRFKNKNITQFEILRDGDSSIKSSGKNKKAIFAYDKMIELSKKLSSIYYEARVERGEEVDSSLYNIYPKHFSKKDSAKADRNKARRLLKNLGSETIPHLKNQEAQKVVDYFIDLVEKRSSQQKFFNLAKLKIDEISIENIIKKLKEYIDENAKEIDWSNFLIENLFVIDPKYIYAIPEINLTLGGTRKVDFGLIDSDGYLDIFEIKRPDTKLFEEKTDRGNYYWHKDTVKAITQAEKYLYSAERKGAQLVEDLQRERHVEIKFSIIKPRVFLIIGQSSQLKSKNMLEDFQILRRSLKNVEIILYDEFLKKLENQKDKVFLNTTSQVTNP